VTKLNKQLKQFSALLDTYIDKKEITVRGMQTLLSEWSLIEKTIHSELLKEAKEGNIEL